MLCSAVRITAVTGNVWRAPAARRRARIFTELLLSFLLFSLVFRVFLLELHHYGLLAARGSDSVMVKAIGLDSIGSVRVNFDGPLCGPTAHLVTTNCSTYELRELFGRTNCST